MFSKKATKIDKIFTVDLTLTKGQIKLKAVWACHGFSQEMNKQICFVCLQKQKSRQKNSFVSFLGESMAQQSAFGFISPLVITA